MKKRVLMSLVVLALIGTRAAVFPPRVFAQEPTLDKLRFEQISGKWASRPANNQISGAVVIPGTHNGITVDRAGDYFTSIANITSVTILEGATLIVPRGFSSCTGLTSVTIPASVAEIGANAFAGCTTLTSVTIRGSNTKIGNAAFSPTDFNMAYQAGGAGTYTRQAGSNTWTKVGGFSLNGTWTRSDGMQITISGDGTQTFVITGNAPNNGGRFTRNFAER